MPSRPLATTRRTALAVTAGLTGLAAGGCTSDEPDSPGGSPTGQPTSGAPVDADQDLVNTLAARLAAMHVYVVELGRDVPALQPELRPFRRLHAAHLEALGGFADSVPSPAPFTGGRAEALREVRTAERQLQRELADAAVVAESGTLAKLLATMSAAVAQHVAVLR